MKGQTIIELKDVRTGKIERHIDYNMMTNAINEVMKTRGLMANYNVPRNELVKALLGGIVLFDEALVEDVDNVFPPATALMIGNALMGIASADDVTEMGSYNSNESGWQVDGSFLAVYDFNTSQANGTIASVCLTSDICGYIGFGNSTSNKRKELIQAYERMDKFPEMYLMSGYTPVRMDYVASTVDMIPSDQLNYNSSNYYMRTGKLILVKYKIPLSRFNLNGTRTNLIKVSEVELDMSAYIGNAVQSIIVPTDDGNIYILPTGEWNTSATIKLIKIDSGNVVSTISLINTTGDVLPVRYYDFFAITEGSLIYWYNDNVSTIYKINLSDSSSATFNNNDETNITAYSDYWLIKNGRIFTYGKVINAVQNNVNYTNGYSYQNTMMLNAENHPLMTFKYNTDGYVNPYMVNMYLASINNLDTPIVKTAEKTMKIRYRIMF